MRSDQTGNRPIGHGGATLRQLKNVRWAVRGTLLLGVSASIAANMLHAQPNPVSKVIAAWSPLALLLTVELISRVPVHHRALAVMRLLATAGIAGIAAWVSYWHTVGVAARYGETGASPYLLPCSVDGLIVVASICLVELGGRIRQEAMDTLTVASTVAVPVPATSVAMGTGPAAARAGTPPGRTGTGGRRAGTGGRRAGTRRRCAGSRYRRRTVVHAVRYRQPVRWRSDDELIAALADVPRDGDGTVPIRRAAKALGCGPGRAKRLLTGQGLLRAVRSKQPAASDTPSA